MSTIDSPQRVSWAWENGCCLNIRTVSEANTREHWAKRAKRTKEHRGIARVVAEALLKKPQLPCTVRLTRVAPRRLDDDNLRPALKAVRDGIADWLGVNDRDPRVTWAYEQDSDGAGGYHVRVEVR